VVMCGYLVRESKGGMQRMTKQLW